MALDQFALLELLEALKVADADDVVRRVVESVFQALIDAEATTRIGAAPHERTPARVTHRNGYRDRLVSTAAGDVELRIPKLRAGSFFPSLLERRRRIDQALFAVVMEAYVHGVSTRKVDDLVAAMGADTGISKSEASACACCSASGMQRCAGCLAWTARPSEVAVGSASAWPRRANRAASSRRQYNSYVLRRRPACSPPQPSVAWRSESPERP
jgi:Transposase, Mutator family